MRDLVVHAWTSLAGFSADKGTGVHAAERARLEPPSPAWTVNGARPGPR
jgi:hypothetical protein